MFTKQEVLEALVAASGQASTEEIAIASLRGKDELFFRNLLSDHLSHTRHELEVQREWSLPEDAVKRWAAIRPVEVRKNKGLIDLAAFRQGRQPTDSPALGVEFKLWYWFDALDEPRYANSGRKYNHMISLSFLMDATKLQAALSSEDGKRIVVTVVPTFHFDEIPQVHKKSRGDFLKALGFPKSFVPLSKVDSSDQQSSPMALRQRALDRMSTFFNEKGYSTVVGGGIVGSHGGLRATTDFVVSEIPVHKFEGEAKQS